MANSDFIVFKRNAAGKWEEALTVYQVADAAAAAKDAWSGDGDYLAVDTKDAEVIEQLVPVAVRSTSKGKLKDRPSG